MAIALVLAWRCHDEPARVRFATFNIENFPKDSRQIEGAFREIAALDASFVAVQEIGRPELFLREAKRRLGTQWDFASIDSRPIGERRPGHHIGVLFDRSKWTFAGITVHDGTRLDAGRHKPTVEVRLRAGGRVLHVLVVHLKATSDGREIRARQHAALIAIVREVKRSGERFIVLGDFNATADGDRVDLARLAAVTRATWATEALACSAYWSRDDGCPRSRLDHILMSFPPGRVRGAGGCASVGCDWQASCPVYVSDHWWVVVTY
jgi:endonuclease/exonuclease/phosphatase family metal-dependent hydrolase